MRVTQVHLSGFGLCYFCEQPNESTAVLVGDQVPYKLAHLKCWQRKNGGQPRTERQKTRPGFEEVMAAYGSRSAESHEAKRARLRRIFEDRG